MALMNCKITDYIDATKPVKEPMTCPSCGGIGKIYRMTCAECDGAGIVEVVNVTEAQQ